MQPAGEDRASFGGDPLLAPSLQHLPRGLAAARPPWRVGSQFWVAFLGGPLAAGVIAWLNAPRLGLPASRRRAVLAVSLLAFVALLAGLGWSLATLEPGRGQRLLLRRAAQATGVLVYLALAWLQRAADRRHQAFGGDYASLWGPGLLAVLGGVALHFAAALALALAVARLRP